MCGCGCNTCDDKSKTLILKESKFIHTPISEGLKYHIDNQIPLSENIYRIGSKEYMKLYTEARSLYSRGKLDVNEADKYFLTETHVGSFGMFEGKRVPLDIPMLNEEQEYYVTYNKGRGQGKGLVKSKESNYEEPRVFSKEEAEEYAKEAESRSRQMTAYFVSDKGMNRIKESLNEEKAITFRPGTLSDMELATKILDKEGIEYKIDNFDLILSDEDYLVVLDYLKGRNNVNVNLSTSILNEDEAAFEYNKARAGRIMKDLFGPDFEFDYTYKLEGDRIIIHPEGYNDDGTLFDMKDVHKEKIIRTFRDKMPKAQATPNMGGGITVRLRGFSLNEAMVDYDFSKEELIRVIKQLKRGAGTEIGMIKAFEKALGRELTDDEIRGFKLNEAKKKKKKDPPIGKPKRGGSKAYYVYVRDPKTKRIKKVSFGSGGLRAKIRNPKARKAFAARHRCSEKNDRTKASYWSCRLPRYAKQLGLGSNMNTFW